MTVAGDVLVEVAADTRKFTEAMQRATDHTALMAWRVDALVTVFRDDRLLSVVIRRAWEEFGR